MTDKLIRIDDVMQRTTMSRSMIYKLMTKDAFPKSAHIGRTAVWSEKEVAEFIERIMKKRN